MIGAQTKTGVFTESTSYMRQNVGNVDAQERKEG